MLHRAARAHRFAVLAAAAFVASLTSTASAGPPIELSDIALGANAGGFVMNGIDVGDVSGFRVSAAGDVNGDGLADLIIGASFADPNGVESGESYVVFGKADGAVIELSDIAAGVGGGFVLNGIDAGDQSGRSVSGAGDVNGDGLADLIVGALRAGPNGVESGESYVVFGKVDSTAIQLSDIAAGTGGGFVLNGIDAQDVSGSSVSGVGDVNGDGLADLIVGAPRLAGDFTGESYVVFGKANGAVVELSDIAAGTGGFVMNGVDPGDSTGYSVSGAGDVNGDGLADLIVGAHRADPNSTLSGESYVVFGKTGGAAIELSDIAAGTGGGFVLNGIDAYDYSGFGVSAAGDVNGDGLADLIVGASGASPNGINSGESYVVFGKADAAAIELSDIAAGTGGGFILKGIDPSDFSGRGVSGAGDVNGDGLADLIVGAARLVFDGDTGESYVVFGKADSTAIQLSDVASGTGGFVMNGVDPGDLAGWGVSRAGDVNGDGLADLIVGARYADPNGSGSGEIYVIFSPESPAVTGTYLKRTLAGDGAGGAIVPPTDFTDVAPVIIDFPDDDTSDNGAGGASTETVTFIRLPDPADYLPLEVEPLDEWTISTDRVGFASADLTIKGIGPVGQIDWKGAVLKSTDGGVSWFVTDTQVQNSALHTITLPGETFAAGTRYALIEPDDDTPPSVLEAVYNDTDNDGVIEPGESITLIMDRSVIVRPGQLSAASFTLPVTGDAIDGAGFAVAGNPLNSRRIEITLGAGTSLTVASVFSPGATTSGSPSGIDIAAGLSPTAIQSLVGVPALAGNGADLLFAIVPNTVVIDSSGGTATVTNSPDAAYVKHTLTVPPGAVARDATGPDENTPARLLATSFTLRPAERNLGVLGSVQIDTADPELVFAQPATLTIEYRDSDVDVELGQVEAAMRVHQLVESPLGTFTFVVVPGVQTVDTNANTVTVEIDGINPNDSMDTIRIFGNLGGETISEKTVSIVPGGGRAEVGSRPLIPVVITGGTNSIYNNTRIEIDNYILTTAGDPLRTDVTIRTATLLERVGSGNGTTFPTQSSAIFVIETRDATGTLFAFTSPADLFIEFLDGDPPGPPSFFDLVDFQDASQNALKMRAVRDAIDGGGVSFEFVGPAGQTLASTPEGGIITLSGITNLTGPSGKGVWGAVADISVPIVTDAENWELYR